MRKVIEVRPDDGWKEHTYYQVRVQYHPNNPPHFAVLGVGFLNDDGTPGAYSKLFSTCYDGVYNFSELHHCEFVKELFTSNIRPHVGR